MPNRVSKHVAKFRKLLATPYLSGFGAGNQRRGISGINKGTNDPGRGDLGCLQSGAGGTHMVTTKSPVELGVIAKAVELACHAPSLHNSQPWRWVVSKT